MANSKILINGNIYLDFDHRPVQGLVIQNGLVTFVGSQSDITSKSFGKLELIDLKGKTVLPGLIDSHLHLYLLANQLDSVDCETESIDECLKRVAKKSSELATDDWIIGYGWNHNKWIPPFLGTAKQLDLVTADHPVILHAKSLHASWVNNRALELAGIDQFTPNPLGGEIMKDPQGRPTGILLENATSLVGKIVPKESKEKICKKINKAQTHLFRLGITSVHDFDRWESAHTLIDMAHAGKLRLRVTKNMPVESLDQIINSNFRKNLQRSPYLQSGWIKMFADGALGPQTAAMLSPYEGTEKSGMLLISAKEIFQIGCSAAQAGWPLAIHAIGDAAISEVLDGFSLLRDYETKNNKPHLPHRIEHVQIISPHDQQRLAELEIIASVQPVHLTSDMETAEKHWGQRCVNAYAYASLKRKGSHLIFGSDAPVESANPFFGLHAAVTRQNREKSIVQTSWHSQENLDLKFSLKAFSQYPGSLSNLPHPVGTLNTGAYADLIVLNENPFTIDPSDLHSLKPELTVVGGEVVFSDK